MSEGVPNNRFHQISALVTRLGASRAPRNKRLEPTGLARSAAQPAIVPPIPAMRQQ